MGLVSSKQSLLAIQDFTVMSEEKEKVRRESVPMVDGGARISNPTRAPHSATIHQPVKDSGIELSLPKHSIYLQERQGDVIAQSSTILVHIARTEIRLQRSTPCIPGYHSERVERKTQASHPLHMIIIHHRIKVLIGGTAS